MDFGEAKGQLKSWCNSKNGDFKEFQMEDYDNRKGMSEDLYEPKVGACSLGNSESVSVISGWSSLTEQATNRLRGVDLDLSTRNVEVEPANKDRDSQRAVGLGVDRIESSGSKLYLIDDNGAFGNGSKTILY